MAENRQCSNTSIQETVPIHKGTVVIVLQDVSKSFKYSTDQFSTSSRPFKYLGINFLTQKMKYEQKIFKKNPVMT